MKQFFGKKQLLAACVLFGLGVGENLSAQRFDLSKTKKIDKVYTPNAQTLRLTPPKSGGMRALTQTFQDMPCGIAVSPKGKVAVSEYQWGNGNQTRVRIWETEDAFINGQAPKYTIESITAPEAICFDNQERLYISETEQKNLLRRFVLNPNTQKWESSGGYQGNLGWNPGDFQNPRGIDASQKDKIYLANDGKGKIVVCDANGHAVSDLITGLDQPKAVAVVGVDMLAVAEYSGKVRFFSISTKKELGSVALTQPVDLTAGISFLAVSCVGGGVKFIDLNGFKLMDAAKNFDQVKGNIWGTAISQKGMYVSDPDNKRVLFYPY